MSKHDQRLEIKVPLRPAALPPVRHRVGAFLGSRVSEGDLGDIILCLQEAMKNAVRFSKSDVHLHVAVELFDEGVRLVVRDRGVGFADAPLVSHIAANQPDLMAVSGRGLYLMTQLMDEVEFVSDEGAEIRMLKRFG